MKRYDRQHGAVLKWVLLFLGVAVFGVFLGIWYLRSNPLAVYEMTTRRGLQKAGFEKRSIELETGALAYWQGGEGRPLVILHGVGDQAGAFHGIVESLAPAYRVLIPDLPGHGDSQPAEGTLPMEIVYAGVEDFFDKVVGGDSAIVVGHSMGAWLATIQAHRHPESVARLVLINGGALAGDRPDLSLTPVDREAARKLMAALRDPASPPTPDFVLDDIVKRSAGGPIGRMTAEVGSLVEHLLNDRLGEVEVPVDLLWGASDQLMTLAYAERMAAQFPAARITEISGCGHHPANECPAKLASGLANVLEMEPAAPSAPPVSAAPEENGREDGEAP